MKHLFIVVSLLVLLWTVGVLYFMGQPLIAKSWVVYLWSSAGGADYSQHITDWYSFSHFLHGIIFFFILSYIFRKRKKEEIFLWATLLECGWEVLENSPIIIERYRQIWIAAWYFWDSVLNSFFDVVCMMLWFMYAKKFWWKISLVTLLCIELFTLCMIRDSLLLNIIMLIYPFKSISNWQLAL